MKTWKRIVVYVVLMSECLCGLFSCLTMLMLQEQNGGNCTIYFLMSLLRMRLSVQLHDFHKSCIYHLCHMRYNGKIGRNHGFGGAYAKRISNLPASTSHVSFE